MKAVIALMTGFFLIMSNEARAQHRFVLKKDEKLYDYAVKQNQTSGAEILHNTDFKLTQEFKYTEKDCNENGVKFNSGVQYFEGGIRTSSNPTSIFTNDDYCKLEMKDTDAGPLSADTTYLIVDPKVVDRWSDGGSVMGSNRGSPRIVEWTVFGEDLPHGHLSSGKLTCRVETNRKGIKVSDVLKILGNNITLGTFGYQTEF